MAMLKSVTDLEEAKRKQKAMVRAMSERNRNTADFGKGSLLLRNQPQQKGLEGLPGQLSSEEKAINQMINERSDFPISKEAAQQQVKAETAQRATKSVKKAAAMKNAKAQASKSGGTPDMSALAGASNNEVVSGALAGSAFGPMGIAAGAALGGLKNLAKKKQKKKDLKAKAIMGQAQSYQRAADQEQAALTNIMEGLRSSLIF